MPSAFEKYTPSDLRARLSKLKNSCDGKEAKSSLAFARGDHWQNREAWVGPRPAADHPSPNAFYEAIRKDLVSKNIVREVVRRDRNGVIGREPNWTVTVARELDEDEKPTVAEQALIDEAEAGLLSMWDTRRNGRKVMLSTLQHATDGMNTAGRASLRFCIPPGKLDNGVLIDAAKVKGNIAAALQVLHLRAPEYEECLVITDEGTQEQAGVFFVTKKDTANGESRFTDRIELVFLDDDGKTVIKIFEKDVIKDEVTYDLAGKLTIYEMNRDALITPQVKQMQKLFNMSATMRTRTVSQAGFPERTLIGVKEPSHLEDDPDNPGKQIEVKDGYTTGVGTTNILQAQEVLDEDGKVKGLANAQLIYRDPAKVDTFDQTEKAAYNNILEEVNQIHVAITGDATTSGESRIQARSDFVMALRETKTQVDAAGRWVLETALAWAADLAGLAGRYDGLRINFDCRLDAGPITALERAALLNEVTAKLRSREDAMTLLGIDDPAAMIQKISSEDQTLNPLQAVQVQRAKVGLAADARNVDSSIAARIDAATGSEARSAVN